MGSGAEGVRLRLSRMTEFLRAAEQADSVWWWEPQAACQAVTQPELRRVGSARLQHPHQEAWSKVQTKNKGPVRSNFVSRRSPCKKKRVLKTNVQLLLFSGAALLCSDVQFRR